MEFRISLLRGGAEQKVDKIQTTVTLFEKSYC